MSVKKLKVASCGVLAGTIAAYILICLFFHRYLIYSVRAILEPPVCLYVIVCLALAAGVLSLLITLQKEVEKIKTYFVFTVVFGLIFVLNFLLFIFAVYLTGFVPIIIC